MSHPDADKSEHTAAVVPLPLLQQRLPKEANADPQRSLLMHMHMQGRGSSRTIHSVLERASQHERTEVIWATFNHGYLLV